MIEISLWQIVSAAITLIGLVGTVIYRDYQRNSKHNDRHSSLMTMINESERHLTADLNEVKLNYVRKDDLREQLATMRSEIRETSDDVKQLRNDINARLDKIFDAVKS